MVRARRSNLWGRIAVFLIVCCCVTGGLFVNTALALDGSGTQQDPWRIKSLADFNDFAADANYWDDYTRLETDVNLAGRTYSTAVIAPDTNSSIGWVQGTAFTGVFDGNDHKITNLTIDDGGVGNDYLGLFGWLGEDSKVSNLGLEGGSVTGRRRIGGLVGVNYYGSISNCYSTGDVTGMDDVGGLVGFITSGSISNSYSTGDVNGVERVGGLVGINDFTGSISNCYSTGDVSGNWRVGGLVGRNEHDGSVSDCYSTGDVKGVEGVGGLVGENFLGNVSKCYSTGSVSGFEWVGGLVGLNGYRSITNCYSTGDVNGVEEVGGLVGHNEGGKITNCYTTGSVTGGDVVGGLVGIGSGDITNCYSTGSVDGNDLVGGLVGSNWRTISNCYSTASVIGNSYAGGLVGENGSIFAPHGRITNSYSIGLVVGAGDHIGGLVGDNHEGTGEVKYSFWDVNSSAEPNSDGGTGLPTGEMQMQITYTDADWDFINTWAIGENQTYPYLRTVPAGDINKDGIVNFLDVAILGQKWCDQE